MKFAGCILLWLFLPLASFAQDSTRPISISYLDQVSAITSQVNKKLDRQSEKALKQFQKQEARIKKRLAKLDSAKAKQVFAGADQQYVQLQQELDSGTGPSLYIPSLDTMDTSLKFLQANTQLIAGAKNVSAKLGTALKNVKSLEAGFQKAEKIKSFLKERRQYLKEQLNGTAFAGPLKQLNKQVYYYSGRLNEYKQLLKDHKRASQKAIELLSKTKAFRDFMRRNSMLASLFRLPSEDQPLDLSSLAGLQTRAQVNTLIQQQISIGGASGQQQFSANVQQAQSQLNELKNKILRSGQSSSDDELPEGFKPNDQKTKTFLQRIELGANVQSQKPNGYFPTTSDIGLSIGYKLNDRSMVGIGASYKLGWGQNIRKIRISHQGIGLRSFVDWKIKRSFWVSGGYEMNNRSELQNIPTISTGGRELAAWQQSGLIGLSKIVSLKSKVLKKTKLQLLWDFMSYRQVPQTQPVLFRIGYSF